ncbi:DNA polymerase I [Kordiimonas sp. SCSIO 12610]|uniref:DNA polymerase I n=1 Tax=Kordiimonas sp. SCSIO 12610 TaxID=2829597 RepID=UPI00210DD038|nr:DNA polymerase I [Kordiimonas sp. SCSIO 12610]UTW55601.1 DNA polymerase I [Kordiimonas sp. SCSIO 12610]
MSDPHSVTPHLYLIDGSGYIFRAYHALPPMSRGDGTPVNAVYGFSNMLFKLLQDLADTEKPTHLAVIFDTARKTFRNDFYTEYKAHRPPAPEDLVPQFSLIRDAVKAFGLPSIEMDGYEADDLIATYAKQARAKDWQVTIVSSDKDLMQLVDEKTSMFDSMKSKRIGPDGVVEKFGVGPERVVDVQSLAGDSVDNVPGVPGIGIKTAAQLINEYGDLDALLERAHEIKQPKRRENLIEHADMARISRDLVRLAQDAPVTVALDQMELKDPDTSQLISFVEEQQFRSLKVKLVHHYNVVLDELDPVSDAVEVTERKYECVTDMDTLNRWIEEAYKAGQVTVDTETTGLDATAADLVGVCLSINPGHACYIPVGHTGDGDGLLAERPDQLDKAAVVAALKPLFEDPSVLKIGQNLKYDMSILARVGIDLSPIEDTMLMSYALDAGNHGHGMDELSGIHLDITPIPFKDIAGTGKNQLTFDKIALDRATEYAAEDADITGRLARVLKPRLASEGATTVYETLERPLAPILAAMERNGIKVDVSILQKLSNEFAIGIERLDKEIQTLAGRPFNVASPKQLGEILFEDLGLKGGKKSAKTGAWTTNADVLEKLAAEGHELPKKVIEFRQFSKLKSTYTDALVGQVNPKTGRVHTSYHMASTSTGRLSSNDPNLQNIPIRTEEGRKIRQAFIAEPGNTLIAADYSQIELRVLAHMAEIDALKDAFANGVDIHAMTASEVFGVPIEGMDPIVRRQAKAINFGIIYGISAFGLARQLDIGRKEAQNYIDAYFERFPGIRAYMDRTIEFAKEHGYVETLFGRKCHMRSIKDKNPMKRSFGERAAINAPIQGTAADIIRRAMIKMPNALTSNGLESIRMLLQVHDELVFEVEDGLVDQAIPVIRACMEEACKPALDLSVPLIVDCGIGKNWDDAH